MATLAGGVSVGTTANMPLEPWGAMVMGSLGGIIAALGFTYLTVGRRCEYIVGRHCKYMGGRHCKYMVGTHCSTCRVYIAVDGGYTLQYMAGRHCKYMVSRHWTDRGG